MYTTFVELKFIILLRLALVREVVYGYSTKDMMTQQNFLPLINLLLFIILSLCWYKRYRTDFKMSSVLHEPMQLNHNKTNQLLTPSICTLKFLKLYAEHIGNYPTLPFNQIGVQTITPPEGNYSCWFPEKNVTQKENTTKCEMKKNVTYIVILGDSNGFRYSTTAIKVLEKNGWNCTILKGEYPSRPDYPDPSYFRKPGIPLEDIRYRTRDCHSCISFLSRCSLQNKQLEVEYLALEFMLDTEISTLRTTWGRCHTRIFCPHADTYQEFLFREYLADRYPDVLLFFTSLHDIGRHTVKHMRITAKFFFNLVESYMPSDSYIFIMDGTKRRSNNKQYYENKRTPNDMQIMHNKIIYDTIYDRLTNPNLLWYAFPTLFDNSTITDHTYVDHAHRTLAWYSSIMNYLLQLVCVI